MKRTEFEFIAGCLTYIMSHVCIFDIPSILFGIATICFWVALIIDTIKEFRGK